MTLEELLVMPIGMSLEEYQRLLKEKKKLKNKIANASATIFAEEDSLEILADEVGSERYNKHLENKRKAESKREKAQTKLKLLMEKLNK